MSDDDIGFEDGRPIAIGEAAKAGTDAILDHPDAVPVLVVARLGEAVGVRVFGPPSRDVADLLDVVARDFRRAVEAATRPGPTS